MSGIYVQAEMSSIMCTYNCVNQTSRCHYMELLGPLTLSTRFKGSIVSDWGATYDVTENNANAGLDVE